MLYKSNYVGTAELVVIACWWHKIFFS